MPWLITESLRKSVLGFLTGYRPVGVRLAEAMQIRLLNELGDILPRRSKKALRAAIDNLTSNVLADDARVKQAVARGVRSADIWSDLIDQPEFVLSICGSQRLCYAGVYFAYENFVRQCTSLATGTDEVEYHNNFTKQEEDMRMVFGDTTTDRVADQQVNIARLVRNALVHAGGRIGNELRKIPHGLALENDVLQVMAPDTSRLFGQLKMRASVLAERAVALPVFRQSDCTEASEREA